MSNSSPPAPPSSSEQSIPIGTKPKQAQSDISAPDLVDLKQKKTRDLPNLSDCHGCGRRINYSNPRERLQPLDSVWRVVLLCKKCRRQVNSGQLCPYCFKDASKSDSDCFSCSDCHHLVHKSCIIKYENSAPSGYSNGVGDLGVDVTVCIDCWVPELLRRSIRVMGKNGDRKGLAVRSVCKDTHDESSGKDTNACRSLKDDAKEAGCVLKKVSNSFAGKARKTSLRKSMVAKNVVVVESANDGLDLILKNDKDKGKVGLVGESDSIDDAELALQLCHEMNGSARIPKNKNFCSSYLSKKSEPFGVLTKSMDLKHDTNDGEIAGCSNTLENRMHVEKIYVEPKGVETNGTGSVGLKQELFTYKRKNRKRVHQSYIETSPNYASTYSCEREPELLTYKRNRRNREDSQQSNTEAIGICSCSDSGVIKPELVTYERNNRKGKNYLQSVVEANKSCCIIEFGELKSELLSCEHNDGKRECRVSAQDANGSCTFVYSAVSMPELVTYKRNNGKMKEWNQCGVKSCESWDCNDSFGQISELLTYKRKNRKSKGLIDGSVEMCTQPSLKDDQKEGFFSNDGRSSSPEGRITDFSAEDRNSNSISDICLSIANARSSGGDDLTLDRNKDSNSGLFTFKYSRRITGSCSTMNDSNSKSNCDRYLLKYSRRSKCSTETLHKERKSAHQETITGCASFHTESELSAVGTQTYSPCDIGSSRRDT